MEFGAQNPSKLTDGYVTSENFGGNNRSGTVTNSACTPKGVLSNAIFTFEGVGSNPLDSSKYVSDSNSIDSSIAVSSDILSAEEVLMKHEEDTFYSQNIPGEGDDNIWGLLSGVGGNIYEWYDFAVYGLLASEIGAAFFPGSSEELQLIQSFGVYLAAFLMRPVGAVVFGEIGDRIAGRKNALIVSIILITVPSVAMGLLPTYYVWGNAAPIILVVLRMFQGLSVGGQLAGSYVLSVEQSTAKNRGFRGSICDASSVCGFLLASAATTMTRSVLSPEQVDAWGWRVPFWLSLFLAPALYYVISRTEESTTWSGLLEHKGTENLIRGKEKAHTLAIYDLFASPFRRRQLAGMIGVLSAMGSSFYMLFLWTPVYLSNLRGVVSEAQADLMNFFIILIYIVILITCGKISDTFPHRMDLIRIGLPGIIVSCPVMFAIFESRSPWGYFVGQLQYAFCMAIVNGGMAAFEVELWMADPSLSFTGVAVGHNIAATIFSGTMPLIATSLFYWSKKYISEDEDEVWPYLIPGLHISILGCLSFYSISVVVRHPHDVRTGENRIREAIHADTKMAEKIKRKEEKAKQLLEKDTYKYSKYWINQSSSWLDSTLAGSYTAPKSHI